MATLLHLNGLPGSGKSSLACRYAQDHPLTLVVDIDLLRTQLGQWRAREESKLVARDLAVALTSAQLDAGRDVVVPQYLGKVDFVERLAAVAVAAGARFVEVMLVVEPSVAAARFVERRVRLGSAGEQHPEADVGMAEVDGMIDAAQAALTSLSSRRRSIRAISAAADLERTYSELVRVVAAPGDPGRRRR